MLDLFEQRRLDVRLKGIALLAGVLLHISFDHAPSSNSIRLNATTAMPAYSCPRRVLPIARGLFSDLFPITTDGVSEWDLRGLLASILFLE